MAATKADILGRLKVSNRIITLDGDEIGYVVSYGKPGSKGRGGFSAKTEYASRIYRGCSIEQTAGSVRVLMEKVAAAIARADREGAFKWPLPSLWKAGPKLEA